MKKTLFGLATAVLLAVPAASAHAALNAYLKISGSQTKSFTPDAPSGFQQILLPDSFMQMMLNNKNPCLQRDAVAAPRDAASGQATGRRTYEPIVFHKRIDKSSPLLAKALASGEHLPDVVIVLYRELPGNMVEFYAEVKLTGCTLTKSGKATPKLAERAVGGESTASAGGDSHSRPMESLSLNFTKIEWTYAEGKQKASDYTMKASYDLKKNDRP